jgi:hypothetical protein
MTSVDDLTPIARAVSPPAVLPAASCTGGEAKAARGFSAIRDPTSER